MATNARCSRCDELWCAYALATRDHLKALKEKERAAQQTPAALRKLEIKAETLGAERAAARVKITTHMALSHSVQARAVLSATACC